MYFNCSNSQRWSREAPTATYDKLSPHSTAVMSGTVGPPIPPHILAKRKLDEGGENVAAASKVGPSIPDELDIKKRRMVGPAPPPAPLDERPNSGPGDGDGETSSDDDIGPTLPQSSASAVRKSIFSSIKDIS